MLLGSGDQSRSEQAPSKKDFWSPSAQGSVEATKRTTDVMDSQACDTYGSLRLDNVEGGDGWFACCAALGDSSTHEGKERIKCTYILNSYFIF